MVVGVALDLSRNIDVLQFVFKRLESCEAGCRLSHLSEGVGELQDTVVGRVVVVDRLVDRTGQGVPVALGSDGGTEEVDGLDPWTVGLGSQCLGGTTMARAPRLWPTRT